jgi:DnaJ-class molecular chaperone
MTDEVCKTCHGVGFIDKDIDYADGIMAALVKCIDCDEVESDEETYLP